MKETDYEELKKWFAKLMYGLKAEDGACDGDYFINTTWGRLRVSFDCVELNVNGTFIHEAPTVALINNILMTDRNGGILSQGRFFHKNFNKTLKLSEIKKQLVAMFDPEEFGAPTTNQKLEKALKRKRIFIDLVGDKKQALEFADNCGATVDRLPKYAKEVVEGKRPCDKYWVWVTQQFLFNQLDREAQT